jgi:hypothetical protein
MRLKLLGLMFISAIVLSCQSTPPQQQQTAKDLSDVSATLKQTVADLRAVAAATPETPVAKTTTAAATAIETKAVPVVTAAATAATQPGSNLLDVIAGGAGAIVPVLPPQAQGPVIAALAIYGLFKSIESRRNKTAATSMQSGVQAAIANGSIVVKSNAPATVDSVIVDHPIANALVDALAAAPKG